jgi:hypothetical protein
VNCSEFDEQITPAVDDRLLAPEVVAFREHARTCAGCRRAFEAELFTRSFIRRRMHSVRMPEALATALRGRLAAEPDPFPSVAGSFRVPGIYRSVFAMAAALAAIILITSPQFSDDADLHRMHDDVFAQAIETYAGLVGGQMKPDIASARIEDLQHFFTGKTAFPVRVHALHDLTPVGAMLHESAGVPLAQVIYTGPGETVYVYQTCWRTVQAGRTLHLPGHILDAVRHGETYVEENAEGQTLMVWTEGRTLCGAVGNMQKEDLLAHLAVTPSPDTP